MLYRNGTLVSLSTIPDELCVAEHAGRFERPAGLFITFYVYIVYLIALRFEGYDIVFMNLTQPVYSVLSGRLRI